MTALFPKAGFIDYEFFYLCVKCGIKVTKEKVWRDNRCKKCHTKLRTRSHDTNKMECKRM